MLFCALSEQTVRTLSLMPTKLTTDMQLYSKRAGRSQVFPEVPANNAYKGGSRWFLIARLAQKTKRDQCRRFDRHLSEQWVTRRLEEAHQRHIGSVQEDLKV